MARLWVRLGKMMNEFNSYFNEVFKEYERGESGELTFRSYLKDLFKELFPDFSSWTFHDVDAHSSANAEVP